MAKQTINLGESANSGGGDPLRNALQKVNENFDEVYTKLEALEDGQVITDVQGSVFGDDSTLLVDGVNNSINLDGTVKGDIVPDTDVTYDLGSATNRFRDLYLSGSSIDLGGTVISVVGGELQLGGVKIPTTADVAATVASAIAAPTGDLTGSVFADDSTTLVDAVNAKIVGDIETDSLVVNTSGFINFNGSNVLNGGTVEAQVLIAGNIGSTGDVEITGTLTVDGAGSLIETVTEGDASANGGIAYSYNGVSIGVTANPVGDFNTEQSTVQVSSGEITLTSTAQQNGDPQYTSTGQLRVTPSNFRISLAPNTSWQGELTFDENEFRIPSDNIVGEGATLRLSNLSEISIPLEQGESTFNIGIVSKVNYDAQVVLQTGTFLRVRMLSGTPQANWVFWIPEIFRPGLPILMVTITEVTPVDGVPGDFDLVADQDLGVGLLLGAPIKIYDMASDRDPRQISINSDGDLTGVTSINNVNVITGVSELRGDAVDQWSYIISPTDSGTATNIAFGYFGEGGLQNIIYGATSIENLNIGPLGTGPDAPLIRTLVSEENGLAIDLDISSGTSGDVSGHVTIGTGDVGTKGEIFLNAPVNVEGGTVRIDTTGSLLPATRITKEFIEFQGASQLSMPYDFGISKLSIDIATAEELSLGVTSETVSGGETTWSGVSWEQGIFDFSTAIGWVYTDVNGVNHVITGASDVDEDNQWDLVFATTTDLTTEYGPGGWGGIRIWNPENIDNTRSVQIDYDGVLTGVSEIVDLFKVNTEYLNTESDIVIGNAGGGHRVILTHDRLQILSNPPTTSKGVAGDLLGLVAFDANYIYYCTTSYSGPSEVAATNYFDVTDGNGHYVRADVTTPSILGTGTLSVTNVMVSGVPSTEEVTSYELISGSTYRFFLANTAEPWNTLSTSRLQISPNIWKRVAWSGDTW